jgi:hypothetical protein
LVDNSFYYLTRELFHPSTCYTRNFSVSRTTSLLVFHQKFFSSGDLLLIASQSKPLRAPPFDMQRWWAENKPASCLWDGWSPKGFLELPRHVLGRWIQEVSGHGDFPEYHQRFAYPPEAIKTCMCSQVVRRGHLGVSYRYLEQPRRSPARCSSFPQNLQSILETCQ